MFKIGEISLFPPLFCSNRYDRNLEILPRKQWDTGQNLVSNFQAAAGLFLLPRKHDQCLHPHLEALETELRNQQGSSQGCQCTIVGRCYLYCRILSTPRLKTWGMYIRRRRRSNNSVPELQLSSLTRRVFIIYIYIFYKLKKQQHMHFDRKACANWIQSSFQLDPFWGKG